MRILCTGLVWLLCSTDLFVAGLQNRAATSTIRDAYDFVIIGGGTAGLVLANRLTESANTTVLVIESGSAPSVIKSYSTPGASQQILGSQIDWGFTTVPQTGLNKRQLVYNRGRCLGGSSAINGQLYIRGSAPVYDMWESMGNPKWGWEDVFPYFSTTFDPTFNSKYASYDPTAYSNGTGPLGISFPPVVYNSTLAFVDALSSVNLSYVEDLNTGIVSGATRCTMTEKNGARVSAYDAYYVRVQERENLHVVTYGQVQRINFGGKGRNVTATGVTFTDQSSGITRNVTASKEVLLCAGAIQSPHLMMISGIGPAEQLEQQGIEAYVTNENVGQRLQDHNWFSIIARVDKSNSQSSVYSNIANLQSAQETYSANMSGPLSTPLQPAFAFERIGASELESMGVSELVSTNRTAQRHVVYSIETAFFPSYPANGRPSLANESYISITCGSVSPLSTGSITLVSNQLYDPPKIDPGYLTNKQDALISRRQFGKMRQILASPAFNNITLGPNNGEVVPGPGVKTEDVEAVDEYIRESTILDWHISGTCAMLPKSRGGVVDSQLKVYGVNGLRVVDASIFPLIPDANIQATVYMVAEKAADCIKQDWSL